MPEFPHKAPKDYSYEYEQFNASTVRIMLCCNRQFDYNLGARTKTIWGFYKPKEQSYHAPINSKQVGEKVDIESTRPYSAMRINYNGLEALFI